MQKKNFVFSLAFTTIVRFLRVFPNNDPIMGCIMPSSRKSPYIAALFAFVAMFSFDLITSGIGTWTYVTAITYAGLAFFFSYYFKNFKKIRIKHYISGGVIGVIIFDIITGPLMSTFLFHQPLLVTTLGQIPFTIYHLVSATTYIFILAPILDLDIRAEFSEYASKIYNYFVTIFGLLGGFR